MNAPSLSKKPAAYKRSAADFYGREFEVSPAVLIPRPETEQLIDMVLSLAGKPYLPGMKAPERKLAENPVILDVGTGSGCIAVTLALEIPNAKVYASDISKDAIEVAKKNATRYNTPIHFIISHLLKNVKVKPDLIVANLPYVERNWPWLDHTALSFEPEIALFAEDGGLGMIKELIAEAAERQIPRLVLEADPSQHQALAEFTKRYGYFLEQTMGFIGSYRVQE